MNISKVIITKQKTIDNQYSFENEVGLSSYDLALISINKIIDDSKTSKNDFSKNSFLI